MKKRTKFLIVLSVFLTLVLVNFPYLFSNGKWKEITQTKIVDLYEDITYVGTACDAFWDSFYFYWITAEDGEKYRVYEDVDFVTGELLHEGYKVYYYQLGWSIFPTGVISQEPIEKNYLLRWRYFWHYDKSPIARLFLFIALFGMLGVLVGEEKRN